ncbi:hypothetical protein GCM10018980_71760 [Streptomyces capoamus]|uniref:Uncharacterized protein n=1 Tax=Streptomyces capoamus TaxID=68183 RepID=A0A919F3Z0_9ACTN|nr:hypothetical protein [Streptomyces capoamus]GGW13318.1 hypothetical protein GCM10010501_16400 [Streptomyces libani subsp. rufus]GHG74724.1 hypothetical protein GCM10018980_71760 [Streptomyces capoamus]
MTKKAPGAPPPFVLWREVVTAYAMPAVTAGLGGVVTHQPQLAAAAPTTIGGSSALVAAALGAFLRRRRVRSRPTRTPRALAAAATGLAAAALALLPGLAVEHWLLLAPAFADNPWLRRLPVDLPVSAAIAATITTWRWRGSRADPGAGHPLDSSPRPERSTS